MEDEGFEMSQDLISWKTNAWKDPAMVAWYHQRMQETAHTNPLKNEVEVELCRRFAQGRELLDVGIGTGRGSLPLARAGFHVTGVDSSQAMLDQCARLASDLPVTLRQGDLARLDFEADSFDTVLSLNVLVHFPHWRQVLAEWRRVVRPGGRIVFDIHSLDHELAAARALGLPEPVLDLPPNAYTCRIRAEELAQAADALDLAIIEVVPYAGVLAGGNPNHWVRQSLAEGARYDRLMSWLSADVQLYAFALFLEQEVFGALTPTATGRMMVALEKGVDPAASRAANARWLERCRLLDALLARQPLTYAEVSALIPAWDASWRQRLDTHLDWPRNRALLHFLLSNFPGRVDFSGFLSPTHARTLADWQRRYVQDLLTHRALRRFVEEPAFADSLDYKGVNLRAGLEYEFTREMLTHYFKAFAET